MSLAAAFGLRKTPYRILTLDGGGVRGIVPLVWMERLEQHLHGTIHNDVDLIAGTSVGAIIACGVSIGMTAEEIIALWAGGVHQTFQKPGAFRSFANMGGMVPKYDDSGLVELLRSYFGDKTMGSLGRPTLALAYCPKSTSVHVFSSMREDHKDIPIWEVCRASTAAPLFFSPHHMVIDESGEKTPLIDGGVTANNPVIVAISEAVNHNKNRIPIEDVLVISFGTGCSAEGKRDMPRTIFGHGSMITTALFQGAVGTDHLTAKTMLPSANYWRFQIPLPSRLEPMDNPDNVDALIGIANEYLDNGSNHRLQRLSRRMQGRREEPGWIERMAHPHRESA